MVSALNLTFRLQLWAILKTARCLTVEEQKRQQSRQVPSDGSSEYGRRESSEMDALLNPNEILKAKGPGWSLIVRINEGGQFFMALTFGVAGLLLLFLVIDSVLCYFHQESMDKVYLSVIFK